MQPWKPVSGDLTDKRCVRNSFAMSSELHAFSAFSFSFGALACIAKACMKVNKKAAITSGLEESIKLKLFRSYIATAHVVRQH